MIVESSNLFALLNFATLDLRFIGSCEGEHNRVALSVSGEQCGRLEWITGCLLNPCICCAFPKISGISDILYRNKPDHF